MALGSRTNRAAAYTAVLVLLLSGCSGAGGDGGSGGSGSGGDAAAAEKGAKAAEEYSDALSTWSARLSGAVATRKPTFYKKKDPIWPTMRDVLAGEPRLEEVTGGDADPAYDAAQQVASRVASVHAELTALEGADFDLTGLTSDYYGPYIDAWGDLFDQGQELTDELTAGGSIFDKTAAERRRFDVAVPKAYLASERKAVARLATYGRELGAVKVPGVLGRSVRAYALYELGQVRALHQEFLDYLARTPPAQAEVNLYNTRTGNAELDYDQVALVPWRTRGAVTKALATTVTGLAAQAEAAKAEPTGPFVGDVYRAQLVSAVAKRPKNALKQREWITEQMWLLHRIREIESTPDGVYERARAAVALQETGEDPRNYYSLLLTVFSGGVPYYPGSADEKQFPAFRKWALEEMAGPAPDLLEPSRVQLVSWLEKVPTTGPLFERDGPYRDYREFSEKIMKKAATLLDDASTLRPAVIRAVTLTRPDLAAEEPEQAEAP